MGQGAAYGKAYRTDGPSYIGYKKDLIFVHVYIEVNPGIKANLGFIIVSWSSYMPILRGAKNLV